MVESLRVIGLKARVNVDSYKFQTFPIFFGNRSTSGSSVAIGLPMDLQWP